MKYKVEGQPNLYKDSDSGVIDNRESTDRSRYRLARQQALKSLETETEMEQIKREVSELSSLKEEMSEVKDLLKQLLNK